MSTFFTVNGKRAISGRLTIPRYGAWVADVVMANTDLISGASTLVIGDISLVGTTRSTRTGKHGGKSTIRIVGGKDGWNTTIAAKGYALEQGIKLGIVLQDAASACGETITVGTDRTIGENWCRKKGKASRVLRLLVDGKWWIDASGVTQTGDRAGGSITKPFTVTEYRPNLGQYEIATESFKDWMPGRSFKGTTMTSTATISSMSLTASDGKIRLSIIESATELERIQREIRAIVLDEVARLEHGTIVEYVITAAEEMLIDAKPTAGTDGSWPALSKIKLKAGLFGEVNTPTVGAKCLIVFMDNDPSLYRCIGVEGPNVKTTFETSGNIEATAGGVFKVNGGSNFVALANLVNTNFETLATKYTSHSHGTGVGPSTPPIVPMIAASDFPSVACTKLKSL